MLDLPLVVGLKWESQIGKKLNVAVESRNQVCGERKRIVQFFKDTTRKIVSYDLVLHYVLRYSVFYVPRFLSKFVKTTENHD